MGMIDFLKELDRYDGAQNAESAARNAAHSKDAKAKIAKAKITKAKRKRPFGNANAKSGRQEGALEESSQ